MKSRAAFSHYPTRDVWILLAGVAIYIACGQASFFVQDRLGSSLDAGPGDDPPWYFLRRDFIYGACAAVGLLATLLLAAVTWRRNPDFSCMIVACNLAFLIPPVVKLCVILLRTEHLFDAARATSEWPTFDSYLHDWSRRGAVIAGWLLATPIVIWLGRRAKADQRTIDPPPSLKILSSTQN